MHRSNYIHIVWGTKRRYPFFTQDLLGLVVSHIKENCSEKKINLIECNGGSDHIHCLIYLTKPQSLQEVVRLVKGESSSWINKMHLTTIHFKWAKGYYASSIDEDGVDAVEEYIINQGNHHRIRQYSDAFKRFLSDNKPSG